MRGDMIVSVVVSVLIGLIARVAFGISAGQLFAVDFIAFLFLAAISSIVHVEAEAQR